MRMQHGGFRLFFLLFLLLALGAGYYRHSAVARVEDPELIEQVQQQLDRELNSGGFKEMVRSFERGNLGQMTAQAFSLIQQRVVVLELKRASPLLAWGNREEAVIRAKFNVEENDKLLAQDVRYLRFQHTLSDGWRYRGSASESEFYRAYLP